MVGDRTRLGHFRAFGVFCISGVLWILLYIFGTSFERKIPTFLETFEAFIGEGMKLTPVMTNPKKSIDEILSYYMGKNTPDRQKFIIENLKLEEELIAEE